MSSREQAPVKSNELLDEVWQRAHCFNTLDESVVRVQGLAYFGNAVWNGNGETSVKRRNDVAIAGMVWRHLSPEIRRAIWDELDSCQRFPGKDARGTKKIKNMLKEIFHYESA